MFLIPCPCCRSALFLDDAEPTAAGFTAVCDWCETVTVLDKHAVVLRHTPGHRPGADAVRRRP